MIRTPLRPLARILQARQKGENPDRIERENIRLRHEEMRDKMRQRAESRLLFTGVFFVLAFLMIGARMTVLASTEAAEPRASTSGANIVAQRSDIVDRNGRVLATNLITNSLYAQPHLMIEPERAAKELVAIFPDLNLERLNKDFSGSRKFLWIKKKLSPEQMQAVHDIGDPGLLFGPREMRLYPNGKLAAHVLGGASFGREGVHSAEVIGTAGVEKAFDNYLRDPAMDGAPLRLSLDMTIQAASRQVLEGGMKLMNAKGATSILMDVHTGEVISMISLPDFDPNTRPNGLIKGDPSDSPLFNRAVQGVYELGSTFKIFAAAQALDIGLVNPNTMINTKGPMQKGRFRIRDFHNYGPQLSVTDIIVKSSNIGTARMALDIGAKRQKEFLKSLGFFDSTPVELVEANGAKPLLPKKWADIHTMTVSYGHGMAASPLHLAAAYSTMVNGGTLVKPTLLKQQTVEKGPRVISERTSAQARTMLREVVKRGTASFARVPGYEVGGKTGTADKPKPKGGYYKDKVIATFASAFPMSDPKYVLIVTLDEPSENSGKKPRRTAGWTAVPVAAEMIRRTAPLLGLRPELDRGELSKVVNTASE
ncbi:cell division protein FtsI (penicillin-binding protein 3) [Litoreibacter meonggei]|uniref:Cell division protein FtsI (Penicillin-binding protein 3) n=1 Tax=Litoreibacter meonggei TaxID=1049199 RepID=A0A497X0Y3_9RHOB|nr:penicillin-binding protein 2 [Litoreibacter meonggei]RLJ59065.1 cell division protein FtsI (penicillin-binding protein 3) [Litoreibacter meonggei]